MSFSSKFKKKTINDKEFQITLLGAGDGIKMVTQLSDILLPVLGEASQGAKEGEELTLDFAKVAKAIAMSMDNVDILAIITRLLSGLAVDGKEVKLDEYFVANYGELIAVVAFALTENFSSFFEAMDMFGE